MENRKTKIKILSAVAGLSFIIAVFFGVLSSRSAKASEITVNAVTVNTEIVTESHGDTIALEVIIDTNSAGSVAEIELSTNNNKFMLEKSNFSLLQMEIEIDQFARTAKVSTNISIDLSLFDEAIILTVQTGNITENITIPSLKENWEEYLAATPEGLCPDVIKFLLSGSAAYFPGIVSGNIDNFSNLEFNMGSIDLSDFDLRKTTFEIPRTALGATFSFQGQDLYGSAITLTLTFNLKTDNYPDSYFDFSITSNKGVGLELIKDDIYLYITENSAYIQIFNTQRLYQVVPQVSAATLSFTNTPQAVRSLIITDAASAQIDALEDQIVNLQNQIGALNDSISALEQSLADKEEENAGLLLQITAYTTQISGLQEQIAGLNGDIAELESAYEIAQDNVVYLTGQVETLNNQITALNGEIAENEAEYEQLLAEYNAAQDSLNAAIEEKNRLAAQVEELNGKIADKEAEYAELLTEYNAIKESLTGDNSELLALINSLRQENSSLKDQIEELEKQAAANPGSEEPAGSGCFGSIGGSAAAVCLVLAAALMIRRKKHGKSDKEA